MGDHGSGLLSRKETRMSAIPLSAPSEDSDQEDNDTQSRVWNRVMGAALAIPGAKVDRASFLYSQLSSYCDDKEQVLKAIEDRPANAGISPDIIDRLADSVIRSHVIGASGLSFVAGLPGGLAMAGTIPADTAQFSWHAIVLAQKLAYLYGWPDLLKNGEVDEETKQHIILLIGTMLGAAQANKAIGEVARRVAEQIGKRVPRIALTKTAWYPLIKQIAKWIGVSLTKTTFARGAAKVVPIIGGFVSAGVTAVTMRPMAQRLKKHLRGLALAKPDRGRV